MAAPYDSPLQNGGRNKQQNFKYKEKLINGGYTKWWKRWATNGSMTQEKLYKKVSTQYTDNGVCFYD